MNLSDNNFENLPQGLENLMDLRGLILDGNPLKEINNLGKLALLEELSLKDCKLDETVFMDDLSSLDVLKQLDLSDNKLKSLPSGLTKLSNLEILTLDRNPLEKINDVDKFTLLEELSLKDCTLDETVFTNDLSSLVNLKQLDLSDNKLKSLPSRLTKLSNLEILILDGNPLKKINDIDKFTLLEELSAQRCTLDLLFLPPDLSGLINLVDLDLSNNEIKMIPSSISSLYNLETLKLNGNPIAKMDAIKNLQLSNLYLKGCPLKVISDFVSSGALKNTDIFLDENDLSDKKILTLIKDIEGLSILTDNEANHSIGKHVQDVFNELYPSQSNTMIRRLSNLDNANSLIEIDGENVLFKDVLVKFINNFTLNPLNDVIYIPTLRFFLDQIFDSDTPDDKKSSIIQSMFSSLNESPIASNSFLFNKYGKILTREEFSVEEYLSHEKEAVRDLINTEEAIRFLVSDLKDGDKIEVIEGLLNSLFIKDASSYKSNVLKISGLDKNIETDSNVDI
ncbi:leucine-rich repeat domain-containing protein, partial [Flavobacteriaceae bacterium]|nr:leucine-rich repeat domain-containing protein [Flavobacteriaceae bacterium]